MTAFRIHVGSEEEAKVEGTITQLSGDNVTIQTEKGRLVTLIISANTTFEDGTRADLQVGKKIEARFDPVTLVATKIEFGDRDREGKQEKRNFTAHLSGREEVPPVTTKGQGEAIFHLSDNGTELSFKLNIANTENITQAHIHMGAVGQNGTVVAWLYPAAPPAITIPGRFDGTLTTGVITSAKLVGPLAGQPLSALIDKMRAGETYVNVHTEKNPGGELRGQIAGQSESKGPSEESRRSKIEGTIKTVVSNNATSANVTIEAREGGVLTLLVNSGTEIKISGNGGTGTLADLKAGLRVQAEFDPATKTAIRIQIQKSGDGPGPSSEGKDREERGQNSGDKDKGERG
ncbi:MAG: CHRD domain-containing protein [Chloroflexi bacterium]|nr:CHRD domain-containing protein [Chloroflexota bacterium]